MNFSKQIGDDDSKRQNRKKNTHTMQSIKMIANAKHLIKNYENTEATYTAKKNTEQHHSSLCFACVCTVHSRIENVSMRSRH